MKTKYGSTIGVGVCIDCRIGGKLLLKGHRCVPCRDVIETARDYVKMAERRGTRGNGTTTAPGGNAAATTTGTPTKTCGATTT